VSEPFNKLQPDRTVYLRGFNTFAAAASIHSASPTGFTVSGTFRDPADFAVAVLYDVDNYYEHPLIKYLPDFNLAGLTLSFDLNYSDALQPIDSPKFNWIDWATLDCIREDGTTAQIRLFDNAMLVDSTFPAASVTCTLQTQGPGIQPYDRATLWYQNLAFDYIVPAGVTTAQFDFYAQGTGTVHSISVNGTAYSHTEVNPLGESSADQATALISAITAANLAGTELYVTASAVSGTTNAVLITVLPAHDGIAFSVIASDGSYGTSTVVMRYTSPAYVANQLAIQINGTNWASANTPHALMAATSSAAITLTTARYGSATVGGTSVTIPASSSPVTVFSGVTAGSTIVLAGANCTVASVQSPTQLTLTSTAPSGSSGTGIVWVAPRGGHDGNLIELYSLSKTTTLSFDQPTYQLSGGSSNVTWNCTLDFTALGIDSLRQCWLTFAPALITGAYTAAEWVATFSNWQLDGPSATQQLLVAGPGSIRIEQDSGACVYSGTWNQEAGFFSKYFANVTPTIFSDLVAGSSITLAGASYVVASIESSLQLTLTSAAPSGTGVVWTAPAQSGLATVTGTSVTATTWTSAASVTISYICQFTHDLWIGTSLYSDRANAGVSVDGDTETTLVTQLATDSAIITRRQARTAVAAGRHTVTIRPTTTGYFYFNFLEAAVASTVPAALTPRTGISPALDFDTNQSYMLPPARIMWMMDQLGYAGPMNEYLGVFWWNQRIQSGAIFSSAGITFGGTYAGGDSVTLLLNGTTLGKSVFPEDTPATIAIHFAAMINGAFTGVWASAAGSLLTMIGRSADSAYTVSLSVSTTSTAGTAIITLAPVPGQDGTWVIDDTISPPLNRATQDWHSDYYAQCASRSREVVTSCSMELVNPPAGYAAMFPDGTSVLTATGFGLLNSTQCRIGGAAVLAYQKAVYRCIAGLQAAAGLTPCVQYGEFLWWYFEEAGGGMGYYDPETTAAALASLGRPLHVFTTQNDDPTVNASADALFLRNRLRDHVAALVADLGFVYANRISELLWPYDVNYPSVVGGVGGQLNYFVNLPVEWKSQPSSGLTRIKVEALSFGSSMRDLDLANQAIGLFPSFGWPLSQLRYLVPVFGSACPWVRELALALGAGIATNNLWAFDHICLYNLQVPEGPLERRSFVRVG
jgi:hypothetical protein